jgi:hypothetical protein
MTTEIRLDRDYYHLIDDMRAWCKDSIGSGQWGYNKPETWETDIDWSMTCVFGHTTFWFKNPEDAVAFSIKWVGNNEIN